VSRFDGAPHEKTNVGSGAVLRENRAVTSESLKGISEVIVIHSTPKDRRVDVLISFKCVCVCVCV